MLGIIVLSSVLSAGGGGEVPPDYTCFQAASPYKPEVDIGSDVAIVYGVNESFARRVAEWREKGYQASMMTGIAWGGYGDYYQTPDGLKEEEIQTGKRGKLFMHGNSKTVGYNVPSPDYIDYIKRHVTPAVEQHVRAIYLEEPEYWARTGWSEGFKKEWQRFYGEPWRAPDSSVDAQYKASRLKYELYFDALREVFAHIKAEARQRGIEVECHVPTHSMLNYAHWRIVSPESHLMDLPEMDGYIAQVWTGTARTANFYAGVRAERTFETAYFEYGQMLAMVRPTGRKVWFLADPVEDNPNRSWADYKRNYEATVTASLMWPEVHRFEVMPWPNRIFCGTFPSEDGQDTRVGMPQDYATEVLTIINALNDMNQPDVQFDCGTRGLGILVSDTMMFQRAAPHPSDHDMGFFYGLALPLFKAGVPLEVVQLENVLEPECLKPYRLLLLTYEGQKPLKPAYHEALAEWVRAGGALLVAGDASDPYHRVSEWWNENGQAATTPYAHLFDTLGVSGQYLDEPRKVGQGFVCRLDRNPAHLDDAPEGADLVRQTVARVLDAQGAKLDTTNHIVVRRGPYIVAAALDESLGDAPLTVPGPVVDLYDPDLPVLAERVLQPGERTLCCDIGWYAAKGTAAKVLAAACRVRGERLEGNRLSFTTRGPAGTMANARVLLPSEPASVAASPEIELQHTWDDASKTLWLRFPNRAADTAFSVEWGEGS